MKKTLLIIFILAIMPRSAFADTVNMLNGTVLVGHIDKISGDLINFKTIEGFRTFNRIQLINNRDFVEFGFFKKRIISGKVILITPLSLEIKTPEGLLKINRLLVRNVILGQPIEPIEQTEDETDQENQQSQGNLPEININ